MIGTTLLLCQMPRLIDLARDENELANFILPHLTDHRRDYGIILDFGGFATIEFGLGEVLLKCDISSLKIDGTSCLKFWGIKRFTRQRLEHYARSFARIIAEDLHGTPYCPELKHFDYDL